MQLNWVTQFNAAQTKTALTQMIKQVHWKKCISKQTANTNQLLWLYKKIKITTTLKRMYSCTASLFPTKCMWRSIMNLLKTRDLESMRRYTINNWRRLSIWGVSVLLLWILLLCVRIHFWNRWRSLLWTCFKMIQMSMPMYGTRLKLKQF